MISTFLFSVFLLASHPAKTNTEAADFHAVEREAASEDTAAKIQTWEGFIRKHPKSSFAPKAKKIVAGLKKQKPHTAVAAKPAAPAASATRSGDFSWEAPKSAPANAPVDPLWSVPAPTPVLVASNSATFPSAAPSVTSIPLGSVRTATATAPAPASTGAWHATEVAAFRSFGIAEQDATSGSIRSSNTLTGLAVTRQLDPAFGLELEAAVAQPTAALVLVHPKQHGVFAHYNWAIGSAAEFNVLTANGLGKSLADRNDVFLLGGAGIVNASVTWSDGSVVRGRNFGYFTAGVGNRFFFTDRIALHSEFRARAVMERIDGAMKPHGAVQLTLGPSFAF